MKYIFLIGILMSSSAFASVWNGSKKWDSRWEAKYSAWIANSVGPNFFKQLGGPYAELKLDCADVHYGMLAYFSRMHGLAFSVDGGRVSNKTSRFDRYGGEEKMAQFIAYLAGNYGTESLAHRDTVPVGIGSIRPGDLFMYKVGTDGNFTRHTYIIKGINPDGTFDVLYSTQQRAADGDPLRRRTSYEFKKAPLNTGVDKNHWGFRRQKMPHQMSSSQESLRADFSQYALAEQLGRLEFFRAVKRTHQSVQESPKRKIGRNFQNYCSEVQDRVGAVNSGLKAAAEIGNRCMDFQEYDANSTPSRDSGIKDTIRNYAHDLNSVSRNKLGNDLKKASESIFKQGRLSDSERRRLNSMCRFTSGVGIDLGNFKKNLMANQVSFHPNDNKYRRWGIAKGGVTRCQTFYGYPN